MALYIKRFAKILVSNFQPSFYPMDLPDILELGFLSLETMTEQVKNRGLNFSQVILKLFLLLLAEIFIHYLGDPQRN